jgi:hypothetical protein
MSVQFNTDSFRKPGGSQSNDDLENGNVEKEEKHIEVAPGPGDPGDEYTQLVRFVSTYDQTGRRRSTLSGLQRPEKRSWWKFWSRPKGEASGQDAFEVPDEWCETDITSGLPNDEVEQRRRKVGWNELTTEKENMFLKFLSYFQGPILYGMARPERASAVPLLICHPKSWRLPSSSPQASATGSTLASSSPSCCSTPPSVGTRKSRPPTSSPASRVTLP